MLKEQKGITLVALVITIIVLLILAGVSITLALDPNNGLFSKANEAAVRTNEAQVAENEALNNFETTLNTVYNQYVH